MRAPMVEHFETFYEAYPKHVNDRPAAERAYCRVLLEDCHIMEQDLVAAAANYAEAMKVLCVSIKLAVSEKLLAERE